MASPLPPLNLLFSTPTLAIAITALSENSEWYTIIGVWYTVYDP